MRSELHRNQVTDVQTAHRSDMLASLEVVLHWLGSAVLVAFIGLAIIEPERVERTLTPLMLKAPNIQIANASDISFLRVKLEAELADEIELGFKQIDAEHEFKVIDSPPQVTDDFDQRSQSQTDTTGSAPIPTASAAGSIDIDQSLAIEFPTAAYEPHKSADAMKRHPLRRAKVAAKRSVSNNPQANSGANSKPIELPPNFTNSAYWRYCRAQFGNRDPGPCAVDYRAELRNRR
jgi:hypothetical protein